MEEIFENKCGSIGLLWGGFLVWWVVNGLYMKKKKRDLLQIVLIVGYLGKFLNWVFLVGMLEFCNDKSKFYPFLLLGFKFTYIFGNTILFISLLLASKGFWITKSIFDKEDILLISFISSVTYIIFLLNFDYKFRLSTLMIILILIHLLLNAYCSYKSLNALNEEFEATQQSNTSRKPTICAFRSYIKISQLFLFGKIILLYLKEGSGFGFYNSFDDLVEFFGFFSIYYIIQDDNKIGQNINQLNQSRFIPFYEAETNDICEIFILLNRGNQVIAPNLCIIEGASKFVS